MFSALLVVLVVGAAVAYVVRLPQAAEGLWVWLGLALPYAALAGLGLYRLRQKGRLSALVRIRPGDLSIGIAVAFGMAIGGWALARWLMPTGSVEHAWLLRVALVLGGSTSPAVTLCLIAIAFAEEVVWRGWVQIELGLKFGARGWMLGVLLYALAHAATLVTLRDVVAGPNPLIFLGAFGAGLCWAFLRERTGRLFPGAVAHAAFTYLAAQYLWRFL